MKEIYYFLEFGLYYDNNDNCKKYYNDDNYYYKKKLNDLCICMKRKVNK